MGCVVATGDDFNCVGMSCVRSAVSSATTDSIECCDSGGVEGGDRVISGGSNVTNNSSVHSFGHGRSGSLAILLR